LGSLTCKPLAKGEEKRLEDYLLPKPYLHAFTLHDLRRERDKTVFYACYRGGRVAGYSLVYRRPREPASVIVDGEGEDVVEELFRALRVNESLPRATFHLDSRYEGILRRYYTPLTVYKAYTMYATRWSLRKPPLAPGWEFVEIKNPGEGEAGEYVAERAKYLKRAYGILLEGKLVAFGGLYVEEPEVAMVGSVWVEPGYRGRGLGKAVTWHVTREALRRSRYACLWVRTDNQPAIRAYRSIGYVVVREESWVNVGVDVAP